MPAILRYLFLLCISFTISLVQAQNSAALEQKLINQLNIHAKQLQRGDQSHTLLVFRTVDIIDDGVPRHLLQIEHRPIFPDSTWGERLTINLDMVGFDTVKVERKRMKTGLYLYHTRKGGLYDDIVQLSNGYARRFAYSPVEVGSWRFSGVRAITQIMATLIMELKVLNVHEGEIAEPEEEAVSYQLADEMPEFPGGINAMIKYVNKYVNWPEGIEVSDLRGTTVHVQYLVTEDGSLKNIEVIRGIHSKCDEEALRLVRNMPKWNPGKREGRPMAVQYRLPIRFELE